MTDPELSPLEKLKGEIDTVPWSALVRHFAFGRVYEVQTPWTLLEAGLAVHGDKPMEVAEAMKKGFFGLVTDASAKIYQQNQTMFDVLVLDPIVLVQKSTAH